MKQKKSGFIQIILVALAFVIVVLIIGKNPILIWEEYVQPVFVWSLHILVKVLDFLIKFITNFLS